MRAPASRTKHYRLVGAQLVVSAILVSSSPPAKAETPQQIAETHFKAGLKLYNQENFEGARLELLQAQAVFPRASVLRNLALCELKTNRPLEALQHLRGYLADPAADAREYAKKNFDDAYARTGHVTVRATEGATLTVDGHVQGNAPFKDPVDLVAGKHLLEVRLGERSAKSDVDATAGAVIEADLRFPGDATAPVAVTSSAATPSSSASGARSDTVTEPPHEEPASSPATRNIATTSLGVVGVAGVVVGAVFLSKAATNSSDAEKLAPGDPNFRSLRDEHSSNTTTGWVGVGVGAAFLAGAAVTFFVWPSATSGRASLRPVWLGTGAGIGGSF